MITLAPVEVIVCHFKCMYHRLLAFRHLSIHKCDFEFNGRWMEAPWGRTRGANRKRNAGCAHRRWRWVRLPLPCRPQRGARARRPRSGPDTPERSIRAFTFSHTLSWNQEEISWCQQRVPRSRRGLPGAGAEVVLGLVSSVRAGARHLLRAAVPPRHDVRGPSQLVCAPDRPWVGTSVISSRCVSIKCALGQTDGKTLRPDRTQKLFDGNQASFGSQPENGTSRAWCCTSEDLMLHACRVKFQLLKKNHQNK